MKAKDKAKELVDRFDETRTYFDYKSNAKQCALICVNEMIKFAYDVEWEKKEEAVAKIKFLKKAKKEINKL